VTHLILVVVQLGVRRAVLTHFLLTLETSSGEVIRLETLQTDSAGPRPTGGLGGLRFPADRQVRATLTPVCNRKHLEKLTVTLSYLVLDKCYNALFWDMKSCSCKNRRFGSTYRAHLQAEKHLSTTQRTGKKAACNDISTVVSVCYRGDS
jgi:hypothetical protein